MLPYHQCHKSHLLTWSVVKYLHLLLETNCEVYDIHDNLMAKNDMVNWLHDLSSLLQLLDFREIFLRLQYVMMHQCLFVQYHIYGFVTMLAHVYYDWCTLPNLFK